MKSPQQRSKKVSTKVNKVAKRGLKTAVNARRVSNTSSVIKPATIAARNLSAVPDNGYVDGPGGIKRPVSPSIQIWKFSPAAYMHVGVRIAGCILTGGFTVAGLTAAFGTCDIPALLDTIKVGAPVLVPVLKASIVAPLAYHGFGGVRQIYQDFTAKGYTFEFQDQSSYAVVGATALTTLYFTAI